jgi:hypothetical protein
VRIGRQWEEEMDRRGRKEVLREGRMMAAPGRRAEERGNPWKVATGVILGINAACLGAYLVFRNKS